MTYQNTKMSAPINYTISPNRAQVLLSVIFYVAVLAQGGFVAYKMHQAASGSAGRQGPAGIVRFAVHQASESLAHIAGVEASGNFILCGAEGVKPLLLLRPGHGVVHFGRRCAGPGERR